MVRVISTQFVGSDVRDSSPEMFGWFVEPSLSEADMLRFRDKPVKSVVSRSTAGRKRRKIRKVLRKFW